MLPFHCDHRLTLFARKGDDDDDDDVCAGAPLLPLPCGRVLTLQSGRECLGCLMTQSVMIWFRTS